ncbi:U3 small nucleolar RNA-associated protein 6 homolog [Chenopodium quinoa]|uniref:U3 small nucleolar RNA-associated protein 6 n=1 Tax=Chenopodium quinoa TaxID=63459 RepID=A0A803LLX9_CHEQI|nr:U3 small nucleolar RNA-associated protein 6 homolog [Chenopodium quinoa]
MADVVQLRLERMIPDLDDLEKRGIFNSREINEIVKKRRKFEYRLQRPSPLKQDFLDYIDYEKQLDRLRLLRKKSVSRELKDKGNKKLKKSRSDVAGVRRIIEIYRIATSRFKGDLDIWFQYLEFCKEKNNGRMKKVLGQVIRFHPKIPAVWIYAAAWEFDHNLNAKAAHVLMQMGLRSCPTSEDLWVEFLRMELTCLNKLKTRKVILGEDDGTLIHDNKDVEAKQWQDENKDLFMSIDEVEGEGAQKEESSKKLDVFREQGFKLFQKIYEGANDAIPSSFGLRKKFLEIVEVTDLAHSEEMRAAILADMRRDFSNEPEYWSWLAQIKLKDPQCTPDISTDSGRSQVEEVIKVYEEAIQSISSVAMFDMYVKFLSEVISLKGEIGSSGCFIASKHAGDYISHLIKVLEKADTLGCLDEDLACQFVMLYKNRGKFDEAMKLAESFCEGKYSDSRQLWVLRVTEQMKHIKESGTSCKAHLSSIFDLLKRLVKKVAVSDDEGLWVMALELFANDKKYFGKLVDLAFVSLAKDGGQDEGFSLSAFLVNFIWQNNGIQQARDFYKRILNLPHPGVAIHKHCIELEISSGDKDSLSNARKLYECALGTGSEDISLWQEYYSMETQLGTSESANAVYWRAKKTLGDASVLAAVVQ